MKSFVKSRIVLVLCVRSQKMRLGCCFFTKNILSQPLQKSGNLQTPIVPYELEVAMTTYGYARVSTPGQELDIQVKQLAAAGCTRIFSEKKSGLNNDRRQLSRMLKLLKSGDTIIVPAFDRLTRSGPFVTLCILHEITTHGAICRSLSEPYVDATTPIGEVFAALVGYQGKKNWDDLIFRTRAGRERARARGVKFGRKPKLSPAEQSEVVLRRASGEKLKFLAKTYRVSCSTISRLKAKRL